MRMRLCVGSVRVRVCVREHVRMCVRVHPLLRECASFIVCCSVLQCVAVCCSVLQCVAVCCSVLCVSVCVHPLLCEHPRFNEKV